jgi:hypothetical protein
VWFCTRSGWLATPAPVWPCPGGPSLPLRPASGGL